MVAKILLSLLVFFGQKYTVCTVRGIQRNGESWPHTTLTGLKPSGLLPSKCVSQDLRQNLFLFVANEESRRSPQGLSSVTTLGLGSEGPRLNICFTWFYTPIIMGFTHPLRKGHQPCNALDLRLESASVEAKLAFLSHTDYPCFMIIVLVIILIA